MHFNEKVVIEDKRLNMFAILYFNLSRIKILDISTAFFLSTYKGFEDKQLTHMLFNLGFRIRIE